MSINPWGLDELGKATELRNRGFSYAEIALAIGRTMPSVKAKLSDMKRNPNVAAPKPKPKQKPAAVAPKPGESPYAWHVPTGMEAAYKQAINAPW
jgi:hypothetical protein